MQNPTHKHLTTTWSNILVSMSIMRETVILWVEGGKKKNPDTTFKSQALSMPTDLFKRWKRRCEILNHTRPNPKSPWHFTSRRIFFFLLPPPPSIRSILLGLFTDEGRIHIHGNISIIANSSEENKCLASTSTRGKYLIKRKRHKQLRRATNTPKYP